MMKIDLFVNSFISLQNVLTVTVLDCNDRPSAIIFNSSLSVHDNTSYKVVIPENSPSGTSLASLSVVDEDVGQKHKCILREGGSYFNINSVSKSSSEIRVKQDANLDYESHLASPITGKTRKVICLTNKEAKAMYYTLKNMLF